MTQGRDTSLCFVWSQGQARNRGCWRLYWLGRCRWGRVFSHLLSPLDPPPFSFNCLTTCWDISQESLPSGQAKCLSVTCPGQPGCSLGQGRRQLGSWPGKETKWPPTISGSRCGCTTVNCCAVGAGPGGGHSTCPLELESPKPAFETQGSMA